MKILLIDPPYDRLVGFRSEWFPLGLTYLASYLINKGFPDVVIYHTEHASDTEYKSIVEYAECFHRYKEAIHSDDHPVWKEIKDKIVSFNPDVVGLSVLTPKQPSSFKVAKICKHFNPNIKIVFGGHHPTVKPEEVLANENVDFVVRGEGEQTFLELLQQLQKPTSDAGTFDIRGLSYKKKGEIIHNKDRKLIDCLDEIPIPARDRIFGIETYNPAQLSLVMTSRGCPYNCSYCASENMWRRKVRYHSIDTILNEIKELTKKYSVKNIAFLDDSFMINKERVRQLCIALRDNHIDITWSCLTRVDLISDELIALMKKAGCTKVDIGIESGNQRILDMINKKITLEEIRQAVKILKRHKMFWSGFFMFGFPTETEKEIYDTVNFMKELKPGWANISIFTPYPGTDLFKICREKKLVSDDIDYAMYSHQNPANCFTEKISKERFYSIAKQVLKDFFDYNSSCTSLFKRVLTRNYHKNPKLLLQDFRKVITWLK